MHIVTGQSPIIQGRFYNNICDVAEVEREVTYLYALFSFFIALYLSYDPSVKVSDWAFI